MVKKENSLAFLEVGIILTIFLANGQKGVLTRISAHRSR